MLSSKDLEVYKDKMKVKGNTSQAEKPVFSPRSTKAPPSPRQEAPKPPLSPRKRILRPFSSPRNESLKPPPSPLKEILKPSPSPRKETLKPPPSPRKESPKPPPTWKEVLKSPPSPRKETLQPLPSPRKETLTRSSSQVKELVQLPPSAGKETLKPPPSPRKAILKPLSSAREAAEKTIKERRTLAAVPKTSLCAECVKASLKGPVCFIDNDGRVAACTTRSAVRLCKNHNCAANNPDYVPAMPSASKTNIISKRRTLKSQFGSRNGSGSPKHGDTQQSGLETSTSAPCFDDSTIDSIDHDFNFEENSDVDNYNGDLGTLDDCKLNLDLHTEQNESEGNEGDHSIGTVGDGEGTELQQFIDKDALSEGQMFPDEEKYISYASHDYVLDKENENAKVKYEHSKLRLVEGGSNEYESRETFVEDNENCLSHQEDGDKAHFKVRCSLNESNATYDEHEEAYLDAIWRKECGKDETFASKENTDTSPSCWNNSKESLDNVEYVNTFNDRNLEGGRWQRLHQKQKFMEIVSPETPVLKKQQTQVGKMVEEWLPNHAIEEVVNKLVPKGETKVKTLVEAFESIINT